MWSPKKLWGPVLGVPSTCQTTLAAKMFLFPMQCSHACIQLLLASRRLQCVVPQRCPDSHCAPKWGTKFPSSWGTRGKQLGCHHTLNKLPVVVILLLKELKKYLSMKITNYFGNAILFSEFPMNCPSESLLIKLLLCFLQQSFTWWVCWSLTALHRKDWHMNI